MSTDPRLPGVEAFLDGVDYPMFVVTAADGEDRAGCLVGFATQTSIQPFRLLVCLSRVNRTTRVARRTAQLGVHLLRPDQLPLAQLFGASTGDEVDKFSRCRWRPGPAGVPLLLDSPRWLVGQVLDRLALGDHVGYLLAPVAAWSRHPGPMLSFQDVRQLRPGHPA